MCCTCLNNTLAHTYTHTQHGPHIYAHAIQMYREIHEAMKTAGEDRSVVVTVLTGAGDYYCSGNDLSNFATIPPEGPKALAAEGKRILLLVLTIITCVLSHPSPFEQSLCVRFYSLPKATCSGRQWPCSGPVSDIAGSV